MNPTIQSTFTTIHDGDTYEVRLHGCTISSITRYINSSNLRQDLDYNEIPTEVQDRILDRVHQILLNS